MKQYNLDALTELEKNYDFKYPALYRQAYLNGMLDLPEHGWSLEQEENPPLFFGGNDIELIPFSSSGEAFTYRNVLNEIENMLDPEDYRKIPRTFKFIPFAQTGGGDLYVFQYDLAEDDEVPITILYHDEERAQILARNFQDYIFRTMLEEAAYVEEDYSDIFDAAQRENILRTHKPYMKERHFEILSEIYRRSLAEYDYVYPNGRKEKHTGLLTDTEFEELCQSEIPYGRMNEDFVYMG
jgi:hypothetical protein